jgi:hypothetical protein
MRTFELTIVESDLLPKYPLGLKIIYHFIHPLNKETKLVSASENAIKYDL